jgi:elongation factor P
VLRLTDTLSLEDIVARYSGHRGVARLRLAVATTTGATHTRSELEALFLAFLEAANLPRPEVNARVELAGGWIEADCVWRAERTVVELDGYATHGIRSAFERDRARDRALQAAGWRVIRITWRQLHEEPDAVARALRTLLTLARLPRVMVSTNQFKNGMHVDVDGTVFKIVEFQHVKPGKGGAFVRTKLKRADDGAVIDKTFRAGEKFRPVRTETRKMQFLYSDGSDAHFMDSQSYEQLAIPEDTVKESLKWVMPNEVVDMLYVDERPSDVQVPSAVELAVSDTQPGVKGDTASGGGDKPATLESGVVVRVPLFVNVGDRVRVDTRSGEYVSRA